MLEENYQNMSYVMFKYSWYAFLTFTLKFYLLLKNFNHDLNLVIVAAGKRRCLLTTLILTLLDIDTDEGFSCQECGPYPSVVVFDGVTVGLRKGRQH